MSSASLELLSEVLDYDARSNRELRSSPNSKCYSLPRGRISLPFQSLLHTFFVLICSIRITEHYAVSYRSPPLFLRSPSGFLDSPQYRCELELTASTFPHSFTLFFLINWYYYVRNSPRLSLDSFPTFTYFLPVCPIRPLFISNSISSSFARHPSPHFRYQDFTFPLFSPGQPFLSSIF